VPSRNHNGIAKAFGKQVRTLRTARGWSQESLADQAKMHRTYIWGIERGARNPSLRHVAKLADAFDVPLWTLFKKM